MQLELLASNCCVTVNRTRCTDRLNHVDLLRVWILHTDCNCWLVMVGCYIITNSHVK